MSLEEITDEDYKIQIENIDSNINAMLILFSLVTGFMITNLISIYVGGLTVSVTLICLAFLLGIVNAIGMYFGIYFISIPNDPRFLKKYYTLRITNWTKWFLGFDKFKKYTWEEYFDLIKGFYIKLRIYFYFSVALLIGFLVLIFIVTIFGFNLP